MFNWSPRQAAIARVLAKIGFTVSLSKLDGSTAKGIAIWDNSQAQDTGGVSQTVSTQKQLYIAGNIKKAPEVGDTLTQGAESYFIDAVEAYKPTTVVLAYRVVVSA